MRNGDAVTPIVHRGHDMVVIIIWHEPNDNNYNHNNMNNERKQWSYIIERFNSKALQSDRFSDLSKSFARNKNNRSIRKKESYSGRKLKGDIPKRFNSKMS